MQRRHLLRFAALTAVGGTFGATFDGSSVAADDPDWLDELQQPPPKLPADAPTLPPVLSDAAGTPIDSADGWRRRRAELRAQWLEFLGPLSRGHLARPVGERCPSWTVLETDSVDGIVRQLIRYEVEPGQPVEAYLLIPNGASAAPGVAVFHSTVNESLRQPAGVEGVPEKAFGLQLAQRGCVTLSPRNYLWPENRRIDARGETERFLARQPRSRGMDRMLLDSLAAVDILCSLPQVNPARIGAVGHSLGAKETLYLAAFDDRVQVTVSSEGGIGTAFSNWHDPWYLGDAIRGPNWGRDHHELLALVAPRAFLLIGGDSADGDRSWPFIDAALPVYRLVGPSGAKPRLGLFNHRQGHSVPPVAGERILQWCAAYL